MIWEEVLPDHGEPSSTEGRDEQPQLKQEDFIARFREHASVCLCNAYITKHFLHHHSNGTITSSLCEDVHSLVDGQLNVLHDYLDSLGMLACLSSFDTLTEALHCILRNLWYKQIHFRNQFLDDFEGCCAAANDFFRMMERTEDLVSKIRLQYPHLLLSEDVNSGHKTDHEREASDLLSLYAADAVYAAQMSHSFVLEAIDDSSIEIELFDRDWEDRYTHNEIAQSFVRILENHLLDLQHSLCNDLLYKKAVDAIVKVSVLFYIRSLIRKAQRLRRRWRRSTNTKQAEFFQGEPCSLPFCHPARAVLRIHGDIQVIKKFFRGMVPSMPALGRVIEKEFSVLVAVHEFLSIAAGVSFNHSLSDFIFILHKRTGGDMDITRLLLCDLWFLVSPTTEKCTALSSFFSMENDLRELKARCCIENEGTDAVNRFSDHHQVPGLSIGIMLTQIYAKDQRLRSRPLRPPRSKFAPREMLESFEVDFFPCGKISFPPANIRRFTAWIQREAKYDTTQEAEKTSECRDQDTRIASCRKM